MAMDPVTAMMIAQLGSSFMSGLFAPEGQEIKSFDTLVSPSETLSEAQRNIRDVFGRAMQSAGQPVSMPGSYVQDLPAFSGGGLPMPIGVTGSDPFLRNLGLLSGGGGNAFESPERAPGLPRTPTFPGGREREDLPWRRDPGRDPRSTEARIPPSEREPIRGGVRRRVPPTSAASGDRDQAVAAIQLLMGGKEL